MKINHRKSLKIKISMEKAENRNSRIHLNIIEMILTLRVALINNLMKILWAKKMKRMRKRKMKVEEKKRVQVRKKNFKIKVPVKMIEFLNIHKNLKNRRKILSKIKMTNPNIMLLYHPICFKTMLFQTLNGLTSNKFRIKQDSFRINKCSQANLWSPLNNKWWWGQTPKIWLI